MLVCWARPGRTLAVSVWYRNQPGGLQASGQGLILIARGDLSPLQNILFGAA
jgi:hypothetical protein